MALFLEEHSSGLPFPTPGDLPDLRIEPESFGYIALQAEALHGITKTANNKKELYKSFSISGVQQKRNNILLAVIYVKQIYYFSVIQLKVSY